MANMPANINVPAHIPAGESGFATRDAVFTPNTIYVEHMMLYAGINYEMHVVGHSEGPALTMLDPAAGIYTTDYKQRLWQGDNNVGLDPDFVFHVSVTGNYGLAVASALPNGTGTFDMYVNIFGQNPITPENAPAFHGSAPVQFSELPGGLTIPHIV